MNEIANKTVREIALENPNATRIFESLGIDYCCGGQKPLQDACTRANVSLEDVMRRLEESGAPKKEDERDWQAASITELVEHIVTTHHAYVKEESPRLRELLAKVSKVHGKNHPELIKVDEVFAGLAQELGMHLMKEEHILFPYLTRMDSLATSGDSAPESCFGNLGNPISVMLQEHDSAGDALRELRILTNNYSLPEDACVTYRTAYHALQEFEKDLHQHIHLENNILFPRALAAQPAA